MLEFVSLTSETYQHYCDKLSRNYVNSKPGIFLHDVHAYFEADNKQVAIRFCPYCGTEIDKEVRQ